MSALGKAVAALAASRYDRRINVNAAAKIAKRELAKGGDDVGAQLVDQAIERGTRVSPMRPGPVSPFGAVSDPGTVDPFLADEAFEGRLRGLLADLRNVPRLVAAGIDAPSKVLLSGPSGVGKTLAARWLASELGLPILVVRVDKIVNSHMGVTGANIARAFEETATSPMVVFFDEIDAVALSRAHGEDSAAASELRRSTTVFLQLLDEVAEDQIIFAATNLPDKLDDALRRRFVEHVAFSKPNDAVRRRMIASWLRAASDAEPSIRAEFARQPDWAVFVRETEGMSGAETRSHVMKWARSMLREVALGP